MLSLDAHCWRTWNIRDDTVRVAGRSDWPGSLRDALSRKGMMQKIREAGPVVGGIFGLAVKGKQNLPWPLSAAIDKVLFAKVKAATGGRLRLAVCGGERDGRVSGRRPDGKLGGGLSRDTQLFLSTVMAPIMQGAHTFTQETSLVTLTELQGMASRKLAGCQPSRLPTFGN